jgi:hypothetical protein
MYFDDLDGDDVWLCNEFTGELLAIEEFNRKHASKKICKNRFVTKQYPNSWCRGQGTGESPKSHKAEKVMG